eukprot:TRINITY_DN67113_c0_g1_i1.p1 TRINITY_DN67113_c0_g1~~TRINITY_DN67113_c0_g1_i1.p1  ORF type:complete len:795 (-),score=107.77 TRINITY_DN67113_c0_g1_i1:34-2418(-)
MSLEKRISPKKVGVSVPRVSCETVDARSPGFGGRRQAKAAWTFCDWLLGTTGGHVAALAFIAVCLLLLGALAWSLTGGTADVSAEFQQSLWLSYGFFIDPGTQTGLAASDPADQHIVAVFFSICGFVFNLAVLGLVVDRIRDTLARWKEMRNRIVADGHTLILGWGDKTLFLLTELLAAQEKEEPDTSVRRRCCSCCGCGRARRSIVLLSKKNTMELQQEVQLHLDIQGIKHQNIIYRQGDPTVRTELTKVSAPSADDILILGSRSARDSDQDVIQTLLALAALFSAQAEEFTGDVFAEIRTGNSVNVVQDVLEEVKGIMARRAVNWMMCLRGLVRNVGFCYMDMVSFKSVNGLSYRAGNELYVRPVPLALYGTPFGDAFRRFPDAVICGLKDPDSSTIIPEKNRLLGPGDLMVVVARNIEDTNRVVESCAPPSQAMKVLNFPQCVMDDGQLMLGPSVSGPKTVIVIGCPQDMVDFLSIMDELLAAGSVVHVLSPRAQDWRTQLADDDEDVMDPEPPGPVTFERITVREHIGSTICKRELMALPLSEADTVMILSEAMSEYENPLAIDSRSLTTIISLRNVSANLTRCGKRGLSPKCKIVTELMDPKSEQALRGHNKLRKHGSYFYSTALETGVFAMAAEDKLAYNVIIDLLDPRSGAGHIIAIPVHDILCGDTKLSFFDVHSRVAAACGGVLLGWRRTADRYPELNTGSKAEPQNWDDADEGDEFIILRPAAPTPAAGTPVGFEESLKLTIAGRPAEPPPTVPVMPSEEGCDILPGCPSVTAESEDDVKAVLH